MSEEKNNGLFGENEPIDLGSDASFPELPDFHDSDFDSIFGTAEKKDETMTESAEIESESPVPEVTDNPEKNKSMKKQLPYYSQPQKQQWKQQNLISQKINLRSRILLKRHWHRQTKNRQKRIRAA